MQKIETITAMREAAAELRRSGRKIAFLPTLGALHAGHASLIRLAKAEGRAVVVSAFVNPLQFGASEDYTKYPRMPGPDAMLAEKHTSYAHSWMLCLLERKPSEPTIRV